jgi:aminoglycoside phosphotransferase (APT) family kinase protein
VVEAVISEKLVVALLSAQFPAWADLPVRRVELDGWDNRTFRLGEHMSVRLPSRDAYAAQVYKEHRWLPVIAAEVALPVPQPLALGEPSDLFPRPWSVRRWLSGDPVSKDRVEDFPRLGRDLARFLVSLQGVHAEGGPEPGAHNFFRGGPFSVYEPEARETIVALGATIDAGRANRVVADAIEADWGRPRLWVHGDMTPSNLLAVNGVLGGVIDFGCCAVGDPACDLAIAWTTFSGRSRETFRSEMGLDDGIWTRARGWALWKALVTLVQGSKQLRRRSPYPLRLVEAGDRGNQPGPVRQRLRTGHRQPRSGKGAVWGAVNG